MKLRRISSLLTVVAKFIAPPLGLLLGGSFWLSLGGLRGPEVWWFHLIPVLTEVVVIWHAWPLKWVAIDELNGRLYISDYFKEISIPFSEIANVTESIWTDPRRIKLHLTEPTEFGDKITFLGTYRFAGILSGPHPIVAELTRRAIIARIEEKV